jgi:hypothetical protein
MGPYDFLGIALNAILKSDLRPTTALQFMKVILGGAKQCCSSTKFFASMA